MGYDHGNYDYSHGLLPKTHFSEKWYNIPNGGAMIPVEPFRDRRGVDRSKFSPSRKLAIYGNGSKAQWSHQRKQHISTSMRRHYCSARKTSRRFRLKVEMLESLNEFYAEGFYD